MTLCVLILSIYKWQPVSSLLSQQGFTAHALDCSLKALPVLLYTEEYQVHFVITLLVLSANCGCHLIHNFKTFSGAMMLLNVTQNWYHTPDYKILQ